MEAEFGDFNFKRCKTAEYPLCACAQASPPPPGRRAPPPPLAFAEDFHPMPELAIGATPLGGARVPHAPERGRISVLSKRLVNARTISLGLRASYKDVACPGLDDGEASCTRYCAEEHLGALRAVTVTGQRAVSPSPPPPPLPPPPPPPSPPHLPFDACANTCDAIAADETRCRDGGKRAFGPTLCPLGTLCRLCGFREVGDYVADDTCATASNGICEDGLAGSAFTGVDVAVDGIVNHLCAHGTDATDCGVETRTAVASAASYSGATNLTRPSPPPPPLSPAPLTPPPPPPFDGCTTGAEVCHAYFELTPDANIPKNTHYEFVCSGTLKQLAEKVQLGLCNQNAIDGATDICSDGGYGSRSLFFSKSGFRNEQFQGRFGCNYGSQCSVCGKPRPRDEFVLPECTEDTPNADGTCIDTCFVDKASGEAFFYDPQLIEPSSGLEDDQQCHDGGESSVDALCLFGTQVRFEIPLKTTMLCPLVCRKSPRNG